LLKTPNLDRVADEGVKTELPAESIR